MQNSAQNSLSGYLGRPNILSMEIFFDQLMNSVGFLGRCFDVRRSLGRSLTFRI